MGSQTLRKELGEGEDETEGVPKGLGEGFSLGGAGYRNQEASGLKSKEEAQKTNAQASFSSSVSALARAALAWGPSISSLNWETRTKLVTLRSLVLKFGDPWPILQLPGEMFS